MTPEPDSPGSVRSPDDWNTAIRAFWQRLAGRTPNPVERVEYERLLTGWAAAVQDEIVKAA